MTTINKTIQHSETLMEPMIFSERSNRRDLLLEPISKIFEDSKKLLASIPYGLTRPLIEFTRIISSYYSNLIEGHETHPRDIEKAYVESGGSKDPNDFDLSVAVAHVKVQNSIEEGNLNGSVATCENLKKLHYLFYESIPKQARQIKFPNSEKSETLIPGEFRTCEVEVGRHFPVPPNVVFKFMERFEQVYSRMDSKECLISLAVSHHRLLWIHPFLDGNGRVARLMTQKMLQDSLNVDAFWSLSRGLARDIKQYMIHVANCDLTRRNDLDGAGHLSEEAMLKFTLFMFDICLDQIRFMSECVDAKNLHDRIELWYKKQRREYNLPSKSLELIQLLLRFGELNRSEIVSHTGLSERQSLRITSALESVGVLTSQHQRAPFRIQITPKIAESWFPGLIPSAS